LLVDEVRPKVRDHLLSNAKEKNVVIDEINVQIDHVHILVSLSSDQKVDEVVKLLKGESSHWINSENIIKPKFSWQRGYGAFSVSPSHVDVVRDYILGQDEHHRKKSFAEEYQAILREYGFADWETDESVSG
jgi:putative transposase